MSGTPGSVAGHQPVRFPAAQSVIAASGTFAYGVEFERLLDLNALGGLVAKGLSREPIEGNPPRTRLITKP